MDAENAQRQDARPQQPRVHSSIALSTISSWSRNPWIWLAAGAAVFILAMNVAQLMQPISRDEGAFLTIAQEILQGKVPYRDAFDHKGPGIYYLLAVILWLTNLLGRWGQILTVRVIVLLANVMVAIGIVVIARRWWHVGVGVFAALLFLFAVPLYEGYFALTEPFAVALVVWGVALAGARRWHPLLTALGAGALVGLASVFLQSTIASLPGVAVVAVAAAGMSRHLLAPESVRRWVLQVAAVAAGAAIPWLAISGAFALAGAWDPFVHDVVFASLSDPPFTAASIWSVMSDEFSWVPLLWAGALLVVVVGLLQWAWTRTLLPSAVNPGALAAGLVGVLNLAPFLTHARPHYWLAVMPWAALLTAAGAMGLVETLSRALPLARGTAGWQRTVVLPALLMLLVAAGSGHPVLASQIPATHPNLDDQLAAGTWLAQQVSPGMRLLVAPAEPQFYYLSGRAPSTDFIYLLPVNAPPDVISAVAASIRAGQFDVVAWESLSDGPMWTPIQSALAQRYRLSDRYGPVGLLLYIRQ